MAAPESVAGTMEGVLGEARHGRLAIMRSNSVGRCPARPSRIRTFAHRHEI